MNTACNNVNFIAASVPYVVSAPSLTVFILRTLTLFEIRNDNFKLLLY